MARMGGKIIEEQFTVNDFFCGAGGIGLGFKQAGFNVIWACDYNKFAIQTYRHNVGDYAILENIKRLYGKDIPKADVWTFGFPCQDLSVSGKRAGFRFKCANCGAEWEYSESDTICPKCSAEKFSVATRSGMFFEIMRLLDETPKENLPSVLLAENVKGLAPYIPQLREEFRKRGYNAHVQIFNSRYWGVPQNRERYYIVGIKSGIIGFKFPQERRSNVTELRDILEEDVDEKYYLSDEKTKIIMKQVREKRKLSKKKKALNGQGIIISGIAMVLDSITDVAGCVLARDYKGFGNQGMTAVIIGHKKNKHRIRRLTPTEYGRLQAFPMDTWEQVVSDTQAYQQFGNAVTVSVVKAIAEQIRDCLEKGRKR